jgi:Ca2+-dependent lipid-binding protein
MMMTEVAFEEEDVEGNVEGDVTIEVRDEDRTRKRDELVGSGRVEVGTFRNKRERVKLKMVNEEGKEVGEVDVDIIWEEAEKSVEKKDKKKEVLRMYVYCGEIYEPMNETGDGNPYVRILFNGRRGRTNSMIDNLYPIWGEGRDLCFVLDRYYHIMLCDVVSYCIVLYFIVLCYVVLCYVV